MLFGPYIPGFGLGLQLMGTYASIPCMISAVAT